MMHEEISDFANAPTDRDDVVIELDNIQKTYLLGVEGVPALRGVSLKIFKGEFIIIYGTSGGGKTSLLNIIGTIDKPTKGHLTICGNRIGSKTTDIELAEIRLKKMGFVFQTFNLLSTMSALENVEMPMVLQGTKSLSERRKRAKMLLEKVGMGARLGHLPSQLSGGEQQRVTIARAIANQPEILLLDEPTGDLDTKNTLIVMDMLMRLNEQENITLVMVTHDPALKNLADRVVYMRDGKIHRIDKIDERQRAEAKAKIREQLAELTGVSATRRTGGRPGATEIRKPRDYSTYSAQGENVGRYLIGQSANRVPSPLTDVTNTVVNMPPVSSGSNASLLKSSSAPPLPIKASSSNSSSEIEMPSQSVVVFSSGSNNNSNNSPTMIDVDSNYLNNAISPQVVAGGGSTDAIVIDMTNNNARGRILATSTNGGTVATLSSSETIL
eukprot:GEZU01006823.1.p1 GENE.GEZU01006823.1~~GEZU01006823.1.p1  ORF type:complete len:442 (+),score=110.45 GEZU01006823.1:235-1560(+)